MFKKENIRKNFLRVKQIADQNLGRVEKSEVLSDDLQTSEKRVDTLKHVCSNTIKKLGTSLLVTGTTDIEKRLKKMPEAGLGHNMIESANILGTDGIMGQMYQMCGECQSTLAQKHLQYELDVEKMVQEPLQDILDVQIPQISKLKKSLNKVTLDMDSAKGRWNNAVRQTQTPGVNMASASSKADIVKDELEDAAARVEQAKDAYTTELFNFIAKETDHSRSLLELLEAQATYHKQALDIIENVIPRMRETLSCSATKPVYGMALEEHLRVTSRDIAVVLESCICYLLETGLEEEGLFRIAGMASKVKKLKASFDAGVLFEDNGELDPHTVAGAMKQYLRELPEPLLTFQLFPDFMAAAQKPLDQRLQALWCVVDRLPKPNYDNFRYLIKFLAKLTEKSDVNKMSPSNIAIVIGPNLIWSEGDNGPNMMNTSILSLITELIVQHADWFFPGARGKFTLKKPPVKKKPRHLMKGDCLMQDKTQDFHATQRSQAPEHRMSDTAHFPRRTRARNSNSAVIAPSVAMEQQVPSSSSPLDQLDGVAPSKDYCALKSHSSSGTSSVSSESTSITDVTQQMKDYERAETLERRDSEENYHTAKGDLHSSTFPVSASRNSASTNKPTNPIITFNPKDREKYRRNGVEKVRAKTPSTPDYSTPTPPSPGPQSVHADMYSTVFALQSLGDGGTWPSYLSKVRAMWDDQLQKHSSSNITDRSDADSSKGQGHSRSSQEIEFAVTAPSGNGSPIQDLTNLNRTNSNHSSSSHGTPQSSPANQEKSSPLAPPQTPPIGSRSPSISPVTSNQNLQGAPLAESEDIPTAPRRVIRKPAPPPPERPYSVAVSASIKQNNQNAQFQTWPRQAAPVLEESSQVSTMDRQRTLPSERPTPPERTSVHYHGHERPKIPPPVVPPGHQRSASTGASVTIPGSTGSRIHHADTNPGSGSQNMQAGSSTDPGSHSSLNNQLLPQQDRLSSNSLNRQSTSRPLRPLPPPPPPPESSIIEETHL